MPGIQIDMPSHPPHGSAAWPPSARWRRILDAVDHVGLALSARLDGQSVQCWRGLAMRDDIWACCVQRSGCLLRQSPRPGEAADECIEPRESMALRPPGRGRGGDRWLLHHTLHRVTAHRSAGRWPRWLGRRPSCRRMMAGSRGVGCAKCCSHSSRRLLRRPPSAVSRHLRWRGVRGPHPSRGPRHAPPRRRRRRSGAVAEPGRWEAVPSVACVSATRAFLRAARTLSSVRRTAKAGAPANARLPRGHLRNGGQFFRESCVTAIHIACDLDGVQELGFEIRRYIAECHKGACGGARVEHTAGLQKHSVSACPRDALARLL